MLHMYNIYIYYRITMPNEDCPTEALAGRMGGRSRPPGCPAEAADIQ